VILIGQYDSPFVRRVAIALRHYGIAYEHRPWSVWSDADQIARYNPLLRVPTLVQDDGTVLVESWVILDVVDELAGPARALLPRSGPARHHGLRIAALATGFADKAVSLLYEPLLRDAPSPVWIARCQRQIADTLDLLEKELGGRACFVGDSLSHADVAVACAIRFTREAHAEAFDFARWPRLAAHSARCEELEPFRAIVQPLVVSFRQ
jgi:glutathione S-transferase